MISKVIKNYKTASIIYSVILFFTFFFLLVLIFASGHRINLGAEYYVTGFYLIVNSLLLLKFPKVHNHKAKLSVGYLLITVLIINLFFSLCFIYGLFSENLISSFYFFLIAVFITFLASSIIIINEILKMLKIVKFDKSRK